MEPDPRWREVWAEVRPSARQADWIEFYVEVAPGSVSEWTTIHRDDIEMDSRVFGGVLNQMIRGLDARLMGSDVAVEEAAGGADWYIQA